MDPLSSFIPTIQIIDVRGNTSNRIYNMIEEAISILTTSQQQKNLSNKKVSRQSSPNKSPSPHRQNTLSPHSPIRSAQHPGTPEVILLENPLLEYDDDMDVFTMSREINNTEGLQRARENNTDGVKYFKIVIQEYIKKAPDEDLKAFNLKVKIFEPELFIILPRLSVELIVKSEEILTLQNTPSFMHGRIEKLENLRLYVKSFGINSSTDQKKYIKNACNAIADTLQRERACIASIEGALQDFEESI